MRMKLQSTRRFDNVKVRHGRDDGDWTAAILVGAGVQP